MFRNAFRTVYKRFTTNPWRFCAIAKCQIAAPNGLMHETLQTARVRCKNSPDGLARCTSAPSRTFESAPTSWTHARCTHTSRCKSNPTNVSARATTNGAAKCDKHSDLQNSVNKHGFDSSSLRRRMGSGQTSLARSQRQTQSDKVTKPSDASEVQTREAGMKHQGAIRSTVPNAIWRWNR